MADVSNLKSNERLNVQRLKWWVIKVKNKIKKINSCRRANMRIGIIVEYRMDEQFQKCQLLLEPNFGFANWKKI